jgi:hypothetical protein
VDDPQLRQDIVDAALAWARAKREWEASSRELARPANYGELKGTIRKAERLLLGKIQALELSRSPEKNGS